jgi:hypothetical protein
VVTLTSTVIPKLSDGEPVHGEFVNYAAIGTAEFAMHTLANAV